MKDDRGPSVCASGESLHWALVRKSYHRSSSCWKGPEHVEGTVGARRGEQRGSGWFSTQSSRKQSSGAGTRAVPERLPICAREGVSEQVPLQSSCHTWECQQVVWWLEAWLVEMGSTMQFTMCPVPKGKVYGNFKHRLQQIRSTLKSRPQSSLFLN